MIMQCDIQLEKTLTRMVTLAQATCAEKELDPEILRNTWLLFLAGHGLAKIDDTVTDKLVWMATEPLIEAENSKCVGEPFSADLLLPSSRREGDLRIMPSLNFILTEMS